MKWQKGDVLEFRYKSGPTKIIFERVLVLNWDGKSYLVKEEDGMEIHYSEEFLDAMDVKRVSSSGHHLTQIFK